MMMAAHHLGWPPSEFWRATYYEFTLAVYAQMAPSLKAASGADDGIDPEQVKRTMAVVMSGADDA